jgi:ABC-type multidrug transport system permease subunit
MLLSTAFNLMLLFAGTTPAPIFTGGEFGPNNIPRYVLWGSLIVGTGAAACTLFYAVKYAWRRDDAWRGSAFGFLWAAAFAGSSYFLLFPPATFECVMQCGGLGR